MYKALIAAVLIGGLCSPYAIAAVTSREVPIEYAEKGTTIKVTPEGVAINLKGESITGMTISDRRSIVVKQIQNSILLQRIKFQNIDGMMSAPSGGSVLRVWTSSGKVLIFNLVLGNSGGSDISVVPNSRPKPLPMAYQSKSASLPSLPPSPSVKPATETSSYPLLSNVSVSLPQTKIEQRIEPKIDLKAQKRLEKEAAKAAKAAKKQAERALKESEKRRKEQEKIALKAVVFEEKTPKVIPVVAITKDSLVVAAAPISTPVKSTESSTGFKLSLGQSQAKAILSGLNKAKYAKGKDKVGYLSQDWMRTQDVIYRLKKGDSLEKAIQVTKSNPTLVNRLLLLGS